MESKDIERGLEALAGFPNTFVGEHAHCLDAKKRLTIPSEWRAMVGSPDRVFVLPSGVERCLCVYPARTLAQKLQKLYEKSEVDAESQNYMRELSANASLIPWDAQGRIRISDKLLDYAQLTSDVVLVGVWTRFELWSPELWKQKQPVIDQQKFSMAARSVGL